MATRNQQLGVEKLYYAADNTFGTSVSWGFANTWYLIAFDSLSERNTYVRESKILTTRKVNASDIGKYGEIEHLYVNGTHHSVIRIEGYGEQEYWIDMEQE